LWFTDKDYETKGSLIKWNPAVKTQDDQDALWKALLDDRIDVIATDHAPHTLEEKNNPYMSSPSGGPLVQHSLVLMMEAYAKGKISVEKIVEKMCHNPARIFKIEKRGFVREGYFADLVIVNPHLPWNVKKENLLYKCGWSPLEGMNLKSRVTHTFVNGKLVYQNGKVKEVLAGQRLTFDRE
jgi:dihydroorotase